MHELCRIPLLGTQVNKGKKEGSERRSSDPSSSCALCSFLRAALLYESTYAARRAITESSLIS
jgi:hypothetical protein